MHGGGHTLENYQILRTAEFLVQNPCIYHEAVYKTVLLGHQKKPTHIFKYKFKITCFEIISPAEDYITCKCRPVNIQVI